jgi:hypothetical protein
MTKIQLPIAIAGLLLCSLFTTQASAQAHPTATGPGAYLSLGASVSAFRSDYGQRTLGGYSVFGDIHLRSRYSLEGEARFLRLHADPDGVTEQSYLIGPRVEFLRTTRIRPYAKFMVGDGHIRLPFGFGTGDFLTLAPGAGVNIRLNSVVTVRLIDAEYQDWRNFNFGPMHPYGISTGISIRLTRPNLFKKDPYIY